MYQLRPMNCPFHIAVYKHKQYSYRDLPLRFAELGTVYRYERSGTMHGLFRVRGFTQVCPRSWTCPSLIHPISYVHFLSLVPINVAAVALLYKVSKNLETNRGTRFYKHLFKKALFSFQKETGKQ